MVGLPRKTVFIDRNSGGHSFSSLIEKAGIHIVLHDDKFPQTTPDHIWLKEIGAMGWVMVTGDIAVEKSFLFLETLKSTRSYVFIFCGWNHASPEVRARMVIDSYSDILRICHEHNGPSLWKAKEGCKFEQINFKASLGLLKKKMKMGKNVRY